MPNLPPRYVTGLDLGQTREFTAIAVLEKTWRWESGNVRQSHYALRHLDRLPPGTAYTAIRDQLAERFNQKPLAGTHLAIDHTGVGKAVLDLFRDDPVNAEIHPITVTAGATAVYGEGTWLVPKKDLVGELQVLLQSRRWRIAPELEHADTLVRELQNFQIKVTPTANDAVTLWREGRDDDLVLAVAIAAWAGEKYLRNESDGMPYVIELSPERSWWRHGFR